MTPDGILDKIVTAIKEKDELMGVVCKYGNSRNFASNPVTAFTLCLSVGKTKLERNSESFASDYSSEFDLCLLAPSGAGGKRLSEVALWIGEAIREKVAVSALEISSAKFNDISNTLFCDIKVTVEDVSPLDRVCRFLISGVSVDDIVSFEIDTCETTGKRAELLNGLSVVDKGYLMKLKTASPLFRRGLGFSVQVDYEKHTETYRECEIKKEKRCMSGTNISFSYEITAESCEYSEKEVQDE